MRRIRGVAKGSTLQIDYAGSGRIELVILNDGSSVRRVIAVDAVTLSHALEAELRKE